MAKRINGMTLEVDADISKMKKHLNDATSVMKSFERSLKTVNKAIKIDPSNVSLYTQKQEILNKTIDETKNTLEDLNKYQQELDGKNVDKSSEQYQQLSLKIAECKKKLKEYNDEVSNLPASFQAFIGKIDDFSASMDKMASKTEGMSRAFQAISAYSFSAAKSYESQIAEIKKVITDLSDETVESLKNVAVETGNSFENISTVASLGATLGIAQEDIASFTQTMVDLNTATSGAISFDESSKSVARFLNVMGLSTSEASNFGSALTYVGDQFAATADEVLEVSSRMAGLSTIVGADQYDLIGLAAEMKNLGLSSESASSAMTRVFMTINNAVATGDDSLKQFAEVSGMTAEQFKKAWGEDAVDTFLYFVDGLDTSVINEISDAIENNTSKVDEYASAMGMTKEKFIELFNSDKQELIDLYAESMENLSDESESASVILDDLSLTNVRTAETLLKLAGNGDVVREAIADANKAWDENTALSQKAGTVYETTQSKLQGFNEKLKQVTASFANGILPLASDGLDVLIKILDVIDELPDGVKALASGFVMLEAGSSLAFKSASKLSSFLGSNGLGAQIKWLDNSILKLSGKEGSIGKLVTSLGGSSGLTGVIGTTLPYALAVGGAALTVFAMKHAYATNEVNKFNNEIKGFAEQSASTYSTSIKEINTQFENIPTLLESIETYSSQLTFGRNGVDTSTEAYQNLVTALEEYNETVGSENGTIAYLDKATGEIKNQQGEVINLEEEWEKLYYAKEKEAWLSAHQEEYNNYLQIQSDRLSELEEKQIKINQAKEAFLNNNEYFTEADWTNFEEIQKGLKDINDLSGDSKTKYQELLNAIQETDQRSVLGDLSDFAEKLESYDKATEFVNSFNNIETANLQTAHDLIQDMTETSNVIDISYDPSSVESINNAIEDIDGKIQALKDMAAQGIDTTAVQAHYNDLKTELLKEKEDAEKIAAETAAQTAQDINDSMNTAINGDGGEGGGIIGFIGDLITKWVTWLQNLEDSKDSQYHDIYDPAAQAFDDLNAKEITDKSATITYNVEYKYSSSKSPSYSGSKGKSRSGGFFGDLISRMPIKTLDEVSASIGRTIGNARQIQSKIASGGYSNQISLNASFNINNTGNTITQNMAKQMAKQITDLVNEELGKAL